MSIESRYKELFYAERESALTPRLEAKRVEYIDDFERSMIPDKRDEEYRQVDMRALWGYDWSPVGSCSVFRTLPVAGVHMELCNGVPRTATLEELEGGVLFGSLAAAAIDFEDLVAGRLNSVAANKSCAITALNSAFITDGAFLYLPKGSRGAFTINMHYQSEELLPLAFSRLLIVAEAGAEAEITISYTSDGAEMLINHVAELCIDEQASVSVNEISSFAENGMAIVANYQSQQARSFTKMVAVETGCKMLRRSFSNTVLGEQARSEIYELFVAQGEQVCDINSSQAHLAAGSSSFQMMKGIATDNATGSSTGRVYVEKDAQQTDAQQQCRLMQLSASSRLFTRPRLEIYADDVKCAHGASIGRMDEQALFYIRQRGFDERAARVLQMSGFAGEVTVKITDKIVAEYVKELVASKIEQL